MIRWEQIETLLNRILLWIGSIIAKVIKKITPLKVQRFFARIRDWFIKKKNAVVAFVEKGRNKIGRNYKEIFQTILGGLKTFVGLLKKAQKIDINKLNPINIVLKLFSLILPWLLRFKSWLTSLKPIVLVAMFILLAVLSAAGYKLYDSSQKVLAELEKGKPVEVKKEEKLPYKKRTYFYKLSDKQLLLSDIRLPVYVSSASNIKTLILDFTMEFSNRYLRVFFYDNEFLIKDRLNNTLEPVIPNFPLQEEGKQILRKKIIEEINHVIKEYKIKGEIKNIHFHAILAG